MAEPTRQPGFPVLIDAVIYPQRLGPVHQKMLRAFKRSTGHEAGVNYMISSFVQHDMRAQARSSNLRTGQLYISLDFYRDGTARPLLIPPVPRSLEKLQEQLQAVVERIANNLGGNLRELHCSLKQFNTQTLPAATSTMAEVRSTLATANSATPE